MENLIREVEDFLERKLKIKVKVRKAKGFVLRTGGQGVAVELGSNEEKREIM